MSTLAAAERHFGHVPTEALRLLSEIDQAKGKQNAYRHQFPEVIHPFRDGNGRMSRLLMLQLLYQGDYEVGRFVSIEKIISDSKETYYEALAASTAGWDADENDPYPWLRYFFGTLIAAYRTFEERVAMLGGRGTKTPAIEDAIRSSSNDEFASEDIRRVCPTVSDDLIRKVIARLRKQGVLETISRGRDARYRRLTTNF